MSEDTTKDTILANAEIVMDNSRASREDWLEARRHGIGGSDAAAALGLSPWRGMYSLWSEKIGDPVEDIDNEAMEWGRRLEGPILEAFAEREQIPVKRFPYLLRSKEAPFMQVNLDGYSDGAIVEAKAVGLRQAGEWEDGNCPPAYNLQGQHALAVTGLSSVWLVALIGGQEMRSIRIDRDDLLIADLQEALERFWKLVEGRTPPATDGLDSTRQTLSRKFAETVEASVELPATVIDWLAERAELKAEVKRAEERLTAYENSLKAELGHNTVGTVNGEPVLTWKPHDVTRIDSKRLKAEFPDIAREVSVTKTERRLYVPKSKALELRR